MQEVTVELGVVVQHHQDEHHTGEDVGDDVDDDDGEDHFVEAAALLFWADGDWEVLRQLDDQRDAGGHAVKEGQDVHLETNCNENQQFSRKQKKGPSKLFIN